MLLAIVEVGGVPEVAATLGVAESTIKTHLGRLFFKTGAGRQADLVKIVAGFANPLIGSRVPSIVIPLRTVGRDSVRSKAQSPPSKLRIVAALRNCE